ncbi:g2260 [Coccomyxa elongata]
MAKKSNGGKTVRKQLRQEAGPGQAAANTVGVVSAKAAGLEVAPATGPSHKPLDYSKFESIKDDSDEEDEPQCYCGERHPHGFHPGFEEHIDNEHEEDDEEDEESYASDESSSMPSMLVDPELIHNEAKRKQFEAQQKAKATAPAAGKDAIQAAKPAPAKKAAPADKALAGADKPKGFAKGFLAASAPASKATNGAQARRSSSAVEDASDENSDGERPQAPGGSASRQKCANGNGSAGNGGGGGRVPSGNGIADEDEDSDGPPGLTDTEEEVPRMRYSRPENSMSAAAGPAETLQAPAQYTSPGSLMQHIAAMPRETAKGPGKKEEKPKAVTAEDRGKGSLVEDEGIDAGEDSDEMDAPSGATTQPDAGRLPQPYPGDGGRGKSAEEAREAQRREREEREKAFKEKQKEHQASRARQKESAAAAAERIAAELLAEEEKNKAKKEKAAAKKKEKKAKKKKVAEPVVPQYMTAQEETKQAKLEAAEAELAKLRVEADKAKEKPGRSAPQEDEEEDESNVEDLLVLAKMKLQGSDSAEQVPKGKGKGKAKAAQQQDRRSAPPQAAGKGKAPMVPLQEALAFAGVQQRPVAPPKPEALKVGGLNNITAREITATVEAAMGSGDVTNLETAIASATSWLNHGNNRMSFKVRNLMNEAKVRLNQLKAPPPAAAAAIAPTPVQAATPQPVNNPAGRNETAMPKPAASAFPSSVQALFGAPRPAASGPGPAGPGAGPPRQFRPPPAATAAARPPPPPPPYRPAAAPGPAVPAGPVSQPASQPASQLASVKEDVTEDKECCVCLEREKKMIFIPCGHLVTCKPCAAMVMDTDRLCPVCRVKIQDCFPMDF